MLPLHTWCSCHLYHRRAFGCLRVMLQTSYHIPHTTRRAFGHLRVMLQTSYHIIPHTTGRAFGRLRVMLQTSYHIIPHTTGRAFGRLRVMLQTSYHTTYPSTYHQASIRASQGYRLQTCERMYDFVSHCNVWNTWWNIFAIVQNSDNAAVQALETATILLQTVTMPRYCYTVTMPQYCYKQWQCRCSGSWDCHHIATNSDNAMILLQTVTMPRYCYKQWQCTLFRLLRLPRYCYKQWQCHDIATNSDNATILLQTVTMPLFRLLRLPPYCY